MSTPVNKTLNIWINSESAQKTATDLQARIDKLTSSIEKGEKAGKDMTKQVEQLAATKAKLSELQQVIDGKIAPSFNMVRNRVNQLRRELQQMSEGAPGYAEKFAEFQKVNERFKQMKNEISGIKQVVEVAKGRLSGFWKDVKAVAFGTIIGNTVQAGVDKLIGYFQGIVSGNAQLSDSMADIQKATGLNEDQVKRLNKSLSSIDTRTKAKDLREIAIGLGQIGEAVTKENIENIDKIVVALGDEFEGGAKQITTELGILRNNLRDIKTGNYGEDVLHIGNAMNVLGAEGLATAPVVTDIANRLSGVAGTFNLTSGQILGTAATFQELGIASERGSTAFTKLLQKMSTETATYADIAGMSIQEFTKLVNTDMLAALMKVAEGARKAGSNNVEFGKVLKELDADGSGAGEVLSKLASNSELLSAKIKLATGALKESSSITEEFDKKNNNLAASLEKISKKINSWFTNSALAGFLTGIITGFGKLIGAIDDTNDALSAFRKQTELVKKLETDVVPLIDRYDELNRKATELGGITRLSTIEQNEMRSAIQSIAATIPSAITEFDNYGKAIGISTTKAKEYVNLQRLVLQEKNREAIKETKATIAQLEADIKYQQTWLDSAKKKIDDDIKRYGQPSQKAADVYNKHILELQTRLGELQNRLAGQKGILEELNGESLKKKIDELQQATQTLNDTTDTTGTGVRTIAQVKAELEKLKKELEDSVGNTTLHNQLLERQKQLKIELAHLQGKLTTDERQQLDLEQKRQDFLRKLEEWKEQASAAVDGSDKAAVQKVINRYKELEAQAQKLFKDHKKLAIVMAGLSEAEQNELEALTAKQTKEKNEKAYDNKQKDISSYYNKQRQLNDQQYINDEISLKEHADRSTQLEIDEFDSRAQAAESYAEKVKKAEDDVAKYQEATATRRLKQKKDGATDTLENKVYNAEKAVVNAPKGSLQELDAHKALLKAKFALETQFADQSSAYYKQKDEELKRQLKEADKAFIKQKVDEYAQLASQMVNTLATFFDSQNQKEQQQLERDKANNDRTKDQLKKALDAKRISQADYNRQVEKLDKDYDNKKKQLEIKQFNREKALKFASAIINIATGITGALATPPPWLGISLASLIGAMGAIQLGTIAASKPPQYGRGRRPSGMGGVPDGPSHAAGGIDLVDTMTGEVLGNMEGDEPILSRETYRNNRDIVEQLLDASMYGGGKRISVPWLYKRGPTINTGAMERTLQVNRYNTVAGTGTYAGSTAASGSSSGVVTFDPETLQALASFSDALKNGVDARVYYNDIDRKNKELQQLKSAGSINPSGS